MTKMAARALLAIWHDVEPSVVPEYLRWHAFEHLPERLALPGFQRAQRFDREAGPGQQFMALIEVRDLEDFRSPEYVARLNAPTAWTRRLMPHYGRVHRALSRMILDVGAGTAPLAVCLRFNLTEDAAWTEAPPQLRDALVGLRDGMTIAQARLGIVDEAVTRQETEETRLRRREDTGGFDYVLVATALDASSLREATAVIETALAGVASDLTATVYRHSWAAEA